MNDKYLESVDLAERIENYVYDCSLEELIKLYNQLFNADIKVENVHD